MNKNLHKMLATNWATPHNFRVIVQTLGSDVKSILNISNEALNLSLKTITLPSQRIEVQEQYVSEGFVSTAGMPAMLDVTLECDDVSTNQYYQLFSATLTKLSRSYPADAYFQIELQSSDMFNGKFETVAIIKNCLLVGVTPTAFDHSAFQSISTFSLSFKAEYLDIVAEREMREVQLPDLPQADVGSDINRLLQDLGGFGQFVQAAQAVEDLIKQGMALKSKAEKTINQIRTLF